MADPSSGTVPVGYLIWNVTDGAVKRHAGSCDWRITVGASAAAKVGFHGATPTAQRASAAQTTVTYASQTISDPPTQGEVQALNDGLDAAVTLLNEGGRLEALLPGSGGDVWDQSGRDHLAGQAGPGPGAGDV